MFAKLKAAVARLVGLAKLDFRRENRRKIYAAAVVVLPLLAVLGLVKASDIPTWLNVLGLIFGTLAPATALANSTQKTEQ